MYVLDVIFLKNKNHQDKKVLKVSLQGMLEISRAICRIDD
jgi:hypothetical protein